MDRVSAKLLEECLQLFEYDIAFGIYNSFIDYIPCSIKCDRVKESTVLLARIDA